METRRNELIQKLFGWYNNEDVLSTLEATQKKIAFYHDKDIDMLKLGCTLENWANICLHQLALANFYSFMEGFTDLLEKKREAVVGDLSIVFTWKLILDEDFNRESTKNVNLLVGLMLVNYTPNPCINPWRPVFIRIGTSIHRRVDSRLYKTRPEASKRWSCPIFNQQDQNVEFKDSNLKAKTRKLTASVLINFDLIATLFSKQWTALIIFVPFKKYVLLYLKKISNA